MFSRFSASLRASLCSALQGQCTDFLLYKCFSVDLKRVGIFYLRAFLITNGSCVMMPIMSVVQQGVCYPSCRPVLEQHVGVSVLTFCLPRCLSLFVCGVFGPGVLSSGSSALPARPVFVLSFLSFLPPSSLPSCQSGQGFRWNDAVTKRARQRLPNMPSQVFVSRGPPPTSPPSPLALPPPPFSYSHPQPRILENRKCILLSDGWAPCSC